MCMTRRSLPSRAGRSPESLCTRPRPSLHALIVIFPLSVLTTSHYRPTPTRQHSSHSGADHEAVSAPLCGETLTTLTTLRCCTTPPFRPLSEHRRASGPRLRSGPPEARPRGHCTGGTEAHPAPVCLRAQLTPSPPGLDRDIGGNFYGGTTEDIIQGP